MTYKRLFDLKYRKGVSTYELVCRFPNAVKRVSEIALMEIPDETLDQIFPAEPGVLKRLKTLKRKYMKKKIVRHSGKIARGK